MEHIFQTCWKVCALVMSKSNMQQDNFGTRYMRFILSDSRMDSLKDQKESTGINPDVQMLEGTKNTLSCTLSNVITRHNKPKKMHITRVAPQDYVCTGEDIAIVESIKSSPGNRILVDIDDAFVDKFHFECLLQPNEFLNDEVISAYIHCIRAEEHLHYRGGAKVFLENTYISSILKRDGELAMDKIDPSHDTIKKRVDNYLEHDMVFIPINITRCHWYLAVVNAKKCEIHILDSLGPIMNRNDLTLTICGLEKQINIASQLKELKDHKWQDLKVGTWPVIEKFSEAMQIDSVSCGLFMLNFMEYWTGDTLSDSVTQERMDSEL
ncbi:putative ubiquitin-like-specific protease 1B [Phragmites australis]|uniref:putative ubiquitin-like-specific protease 1B n=1 Tax=Phragmites australis TaxID=29695 RepID=UPI002D78A85F|nr:putative ubiquitin-like-specific protease 1B [Phragmites australis]